MHEINKTRVMENMLRFMTELLNDSLLEKKELKQKNKELEKKIELLISQF